MLNDTLTATVSTFDEGHSKEVGVIKVASTSRSTAVAGAIAGIMRERRFVEMQAIGAGAVNQAVKALAIARSYLDEDGISIVCIPKFSKIEIDGKERTAIRFSVEAQP